MDKHQLSKVLEILPDDFTFRAVIDEGWEASQEDLLGSQSLEGSEEENAALIKEFIEVSWWGDWEHHYDIKSKQWIDYEYYWTNRILETLETAGIFMADEEEFLIEAEKEEVISLICEWHDDLQDFYNNNIDEFIIYYKKIYKKGH